MDQSSRLAAPLCAEILLYHGCDSKNPKVRHRRIYRSTGIVLLSGQWSHAEVCKIVIIRIFKSYTPQCFNGMNAVLERWNFLHGARTAAATATTLSTTVLGVESYREATRIAVRCY
jgi:hypothetical protein